MAVSTIKTQTESVVTISDVMFAKGSGITVTVSGWGTKTLTPSAYTSIGTLPEAYRPRETRFIPALAGDSANIPAIMRILTDGDVSILCSQAITNRFFAVGGAYIL